MAVPRNTDLVSVPNEGPPHFTWGLHEGEALGVYRNDDPMAGYDQRSGNGYQDRGMTALGSTFRGDSAMRSDKSLAIDGAFSTRNDGEHNTGSISRSGNMPSRVSNGMFGLPGLGAFNLNPMTWSMMTAATVGMSALVAVLLVRRLLKK